MPGAVFTSSSQLRPCAIAHHVDAAPAGAARVRRTRAAQARAVPPRRRLRGRGTGTACPRRRTSRCSRRTRPSARCGSLGSTSPAENADRQFVALDQRFHQQVAADTARPARPPDPDRDSSNTRVTPTLEPSHAGFTISGKPTCAAAACTSAPRGSATNFGVGRPERLPHPLGAGLVHRQRRTEHARTGVRHAQRFQRALQHAVFATAVLAVQDVEHAREMAGAQRIEQRRNAVDRMRIDAARLQRREHVAAGIERHLALGRAAAHHHGDATELAGISDLDAHLLVLRLPACAISTAAAPMSPAPSSSSRSPSRSSGGSVSLQVARMLDQHRIDLAARTHRARQRAAVGAGDRRFAGRIDVGQHQHVGLGQHVGEIVEQIARAACSDAAGNATTSRRSGQPPRAAANTAASSRG